MAESRKQTVLSYTEKELAAIEALKKADRPMSAKDLGITNAVLTSLANKEKKVNEGTLSIGDVPLFRLGKEDATEVVEVEKTVKHYWAVRD